MSKVECENYMLSILNMIDKDLKTLSPEEKAGVTICFQFCCSLLQDRVAVSKNSKEMKVRA